MKNSMIAGIVLAAGLTVASPMLAWSADQQPPAGQPEASGQGMPGMGQGMMGGMDGQGMGGRGMMGGQGMMGRQGMMHRMMMRRMQMSPEQRCEERLAHRAARVAYTAAKLKLTPEQKPLWDKLSATLQAARDKQQQLCGALKAGGQATVLDRVGRAEQLLSTRLDALHQIRQPLEQLYQALSPEQKAVIDHAGMRG